MKRFSMAFQSLNGYRWRCSIPFDDSQYLPAMWPFLSQTVQGLPGRSYWRMLATTAGAGILGGIIAGFLAGYVVKGLKLQPLNCRQV